MHEFSAKVDAVVRDAHAAVAAGEPLTDVERRFLGKKGELKTLQTRLADLAPADRPRAGEQLQHARRELVEHLDGVRAGRTEHGHQPPPFDPTLPGEDWLTGGLHPITQMVYDLNDAFAALDFDIYEAPEITSELYAFDNLNFPPNHPARESMDTYWLSDSAGKRGAERLCLRPHLTGASVRYMQTHEPPYRFVYPGRVFRNEARDSGHERAFSQYEALIVERDLPFAAGKLLVSNVLSRVFGHHVETRMRVGFFPFTEPGFEIDMQCQVCGGDGCSVCKRTGWLEVMPGGAPHPNVLRVAGVDPDEWMGFYLNVGLDRLVMMRYGIDDIRHFTNGDLRFLSHFR